MRIVEQFESAVRHDRVVMRAGALPPRISLEFNVATHGHTCRMKRGADGRKRTLACRTCQRRKKEERADEGGSGTRGRKPRTEKRRGE